MNDNGLLASASATDKLPLLISTPQDRIDESVNPPRRIHNPDFAFNYTSKIFEWNEYHACGEGYYGRLCQSCMKGVLSWKLGSVNS